MSCTRQDVLEKLAEAPRWIDTATMTNLVNGQSGTVGAILSKLVMYGKIERRLIPGKSNTYQYRAKPKQEAPCATTSQSTSAA